MKDRAKRLVAIKSIINNARVSNQDELLHQLQQDGFILTQATLSRDLKFLKVGKVPDNEKGYVYVFQEEKIRDENSSNGDNFPVNGFRSIEFAQNLAVIKTIPGYAGGIASIIDNHKPYEILGTIAGDDTILLIPREGISRNDVINALMIMMPGLSAKVSL